MSTPNDWLNVGLPKGRLAAEITELLIESGLLREGTKPSNRLIMEDEQRRIRYVWLRPADTLTYVERGVAAIGVAGKDVLEEARAAVDELDVVRSGVLHGQTLSECLGEEIELEQGGVLQHREGPLVWIGDERDEGVHQRPR